MKSLIISGGPVSRPDYRYGGETIGLDEVSSYHGDNNHLPRMETPPSLPNCGTSEKRGVTRPSAGQVSIVIPALIRATDMRK